MQLELNDEEAKVLCSVVDNYTAHLEVEIHRTERRDFREALQKREKGCAGYTRIRKCV